jgi:hypothetical protein
MKLTTKKIEATTKKIEILKKIKSIVNTEEIFNKKINTRWTINNCDSKRESIECFLSAKIEKLVNSITKKSNICKNYQNLVSGNCD